MKEKKFWDDLRPDPKGKAFFECLWRSPLQALCFLMYSRLACEATWRGHANFPKLIQIKVTGLHWKWSTLCFVEPYPRSTKRIVFLRVNVSIFLFTTQLVQSVIVFVSSSFLTSTKMTQVLCSSLLLVWFVFMLIVTYSNVHYFALNSHDKLTDPRVTAQSCLVIFFYLGLKKYQNSLVALRIRNLIQERLNKDLYNWRHAVTNT